MKLLIFCPYYPPHVGGLESHSDEFNLHMAAEGYEITVFTPHLPIDSPREETKYKRVKIIRFPAFEIIPNYPLPKFWQGTFWSQWLSLFTRTPDIVISRTRFFFTSILALFYSKKKKLPWIHIEHGSDFVQLKNPIFKFLARLYDHTLGKIVLVLATDIVANSNASLDFVKKISPRSKGIVIYRGISREKIKNAHPAVEIKEKHPDKIITYIGRLIDGKGVFELLNAFKKISDTSVSLLIVGDGPQRSILVKKTKSLNIKNNVFFLGAKSNGEALGIIKISDIIVNPSHTEGLPTSVIEAALCKKAIVATDVGGTREVISDNKSGYLVPPKKAETLARKINILLNDQKLARTFGENAYKGAIYKFNWKNSIQKYKEIFKDHVFTS